jgi:hypothetical protein
VYGQHAITQSPAHTPSSFTLDSTSAGGFPNAAGARGVSAAIVTDGGARLRRPGNRFTMYTLTITCGRTKVDEAVVLRRSLRIGRQADNDIRITEPTVSAHHAIVHADGNGVLIEDLDSTNGTYVNGRRVSAQPLASGDVITIGQHQLIFRSTATDDAGPAHERTVELDQSEVEQLLQAEGLAGTRIRWVAQDADGTWWGFEYEPSRTEHGWQDTDGRPAIRLKRGPAEPQWRASLRRV